MKMPFGYMSEAYSGKDLEDFRVKKNSFEKNSNSFFFEHQEDRGWLTVIEKQGLHQAAEILENYGINSETDVSVLDRDDFCKLVSRGLKPLEAKKLQRWCDAVCARAENMFPSSLNTTSG